jgi:uncharacterized protein
MKSKLLLDTPGEKTWALIFDTGEEAVAGMLEFAEKESITAAHFSAIGAFSRAVLGYFDWQTKQYARIPVDEQAEVVTLLGDIAIGDGKPKLHAHAALAKRGGVTVGGHLMEGYVRPTLEVVLTRSPAYLKRQFDEASGIALIKI